MPEAKTVEQVRAEFMNQIRGAAEYWSLPQELSAKERCDGLAFSILVIIDGGTLPLPGMDLVLRPHSEDKAYCQGRGEDWYEDGMVINVCQLHELL
jgi:hypothetical protein